MRVHYYSLYSKYTLTTMVYLVHPKQFYVQSLFNLARSELFGIRFRLPGSLSRWVAGYEILAFEKPCLHYHKISTECQTNIHME